MSFVRALEDALSRRAPLMNRPEHTDCYRLFCGETEGIPGLVAERFGPVVFLQKHLGKCGLGDSQLAEIGRFYVDKMGVRAVYLKPFATDRSHQVPDEALYSPTPLAGEPTPEVVECLENGCRYGIRPYAGFMVGLFLDQRDNREWVARQTGGKRLLNTFAYTCGFSVAAARSGAVTTSVDLSKKYLGWGRENFERNGLDAAAHEFFVEDTFRFLKRAAAKGRRWDAVVLDPPSFSRGPGGTFSVRKDAAALIRLASEVVAPDGVLFFSTNFSDWTDGDVRKRISQALQGARAFRIEGLPPVPIDFRPAPTIRCSSARFEA